ncbi:Protein kinase domain containing protein [Entamoeba marina]
MDSNSLPTIRFVNYFSYVEPHFKQFEEYNIFLHRVLTITKQERLLIRYQVSGEEMSIFEPLGNLFRNPSMKQKSGILKVDNVVLGSYCEIGCDSDNATVEFWIICEPISMLTFNDYFGRQTPKPDEIKFMTFDLLKISKDISQISNPCVINEDTIILKRDPASPFPKVMLSPLAFLIASLLEFEEEEYEQPLPQLASKIQGLGTIEGNADIIQHLANGTPIEEIFKMGFVQNIISFVNGPICSLGTYQPLESLGSGSFGTVMKGADSTGNLVAIKESCKKNIDTLKREAVIMRLCDHKNIVNFINFTITQDSLAFRLKVRNVELAFPHAFLIMEYCDGGDLDKLVEQHRDREELLPLDLIGNIFYQIAAAQKYLHFEKGMIHRDIKLENYLLIKNEPYPIVKLCDFGFGRAIYDEMETYKGTPLFAAPEIIKKHPYSTKSDLYSLGICLYRLTTTSYPFATTRDLFFRQMREQKPLQFPSSFHTPAYELIIDLAVKLTKHTEEERISWEDFYDHPYMKQISPN